MGFKIKRLVSQAIPAVTSAVGAYFGGPAGAAVGYSGGENVAGIVGLGQDQLNAEEELKRNKQLADYQFGKNVEMWNLQNAYNDPSQQMARLQAAGLNPNLVYGGGNVTGNTTSGYPTYDSPEYKYSDTSVARKQLALAMEEHQQRITNQAIENDLARQRLVLAERNADREDALTKAQIQMMKANYGLTSETNEFNRLSRGDALALQKFKEAHRIWERRRDSVPWGIRTFDKKRASEFIGREPMLMDYL